MLQQPKGVKKRRIESDISFCVLFLNQQIRQGRKLLITHRRRLVNNLSLLVVDLFRLLIAEEEHNGAKQEDQCSPADAVCPSELPHRTITVCKLSGKEDRIDDERDEQRDEGKHHDKNGDAVKLIFQIRINRFQAQAREQCGN